MQSCNYNKRGLYVYDSASTPALRPMHCTVQMFESNFYIKPSLARFYVSPEVWVFARQTAYMQIGVRKRPDRFSVESLNPNGNSGKGETVCAYSLLHELHSLSKRCHDGDRKQP